jgi:hypothetical protein
MGGELKELGVFLEMISQGLLRAIKRFINQGNLEYSIAYACGTAASLSSAVLVWNTTGDAPPVDITPDPLRETEGVLIGVTLSEPPCLTLLTSSSSSLGV